MNALSSIMKNIIKKMMPDSFQPFAQHAYRTISMRRTPRFRKYVNHSTHVLNCVIAYNKYGGYCIPQSSLYRGAAQKILAGQVYEPNTIEFITANCNNGDIIHAGTYFGDFLPALSRSCKQKVWAFEPNPENFRCAQITVNINGLENVELSHACLGEVAGEFLLMTADIKGIALGGASRVLSPENNTSIRHGQHERVQCVTVDDVIPAPRRVSILHLDVERFEQQALSGALQTIQRCRPIIILEHLPESNWLADHILTLGYRQQGKVHHNTVLISQQ